MMLKSSQKRQPSYNRLSYFHFGTRIEKRLTAVGTGWATPSAYAIPLGCIEPGMVILLPRLHSIDRYELCGREYGGAASTVRHLPHKALVDL